MRFQALPDASYWIIVCAVVLYICSYSTTLLTAQTRTENRVEQHRVEQHRVEQHRVEQQYDFAPIEKLLNDSLQKFDGGYALLLVQDGKIIYEKKAGTITPDTPLLIASAAKWFASALLMTFWDEKKIALTDSLGKFLPYLQTDKSGITIRQLFSQTSGIKGETPIMRDMSLTLQQATFKIADEPLLYKPGTGFLYGGASMQMGGRIVEILGQKSWEQLFRERVALPLGLKNSNFYGLGVTANPLIGGGAQSTAREYVRFLQMLANKGMYDNKRILSEAAIAEMHKEQTGGVPVLKQVSTTGVERSFPPEQSNYGLGVWRVSNSTTGELWELNAQGRFGFSPWIDIRRNVIGVLATKTPLSTILPTYKRMKNLVREIIPVLQPAIEAKIEQKTERK